MRLLPLLALLVFVAACSGNGTSPADAAGPGAANPEAATNTASSANYDAQLADRSRFGKVVIASVNLGKPSRTYLAEHEARIDAMVAARLRDAGYTVLPTDLFATAWREGLRLWGEPYNPTTGKLNENAYMAVMGEALRYLAQNTEAQAIVFTNLNEEQVYFSPSGNHSAHFLGVTRKPATRGGDGVSSDFDWVQGVDAVGIYVTVFDMKFNRLFSGAGGIEVTETLDLKGSTPRWMRSKKILDNEDLIEEGMDLALKPWIEAD